MKRAVRLAARARGRAEPNPLVGCVLVRSGEVIAEGWHRRYGAAHAEVDALNQAKKQGISPAGCDVYVTLEPCCHEGKTPPCTDALINAGVGRVYAAMIDPSEHAAGKGIARLKEAGIAAETGICEQLARELNEPFIKRVNTGMPWVIAKWAQTLDGFIATSSGDSKWISNPQSRRTVHRIRGRVDAVVSGIGTIIADDARLTARDVPLLRQARKIIVDPDLRISGSAAVLSEPTTVTLAVRESTLRKSAERVAELRSRGTEIISLPVEPGSITELSLKPLLRHMGQRYSATNILVEAGAGLLAALFKQKLVDQALVFIAPRLLGDAAALPPVHWGSADRIADALRLNLKQVRRIGDDLMLDYRL